MVATASLTTRIVNPIIESTFEAFQMMMDVKCRKTGMSLMDPDCPLATASAVIGLAGRISGSICFNVSREVAFNIVKRTVDVDVEEVTSLVCDCIAEFANVIAGSAKDRVEELDLQLGMPTVVKGERHILFFPNASQPVRIDFDSDIGPFAILFGFSEGG